MVPAAVARQGCECGLKNLEQTGSAEQATSASWACFAKLDVWIKSEGGADMFGNRQSCLERAKGRFSTLSQVNFMCAQEPGYFAELAHECAVAGSAQAESCIALKTAAAGMM